MCIQKKTYIVAHRPRISDRVTHMACEFVLYVRQKTTPANHTRLNTKHTHTMTATAFTPRAIHTMMYVCLGRPRDAMR